MFTTLMTQKGRVLHNISQLVAIMKENTFLFRKSASFHAKLACLLFHFLCEYDRYMAVIDEAIKYLCTVCMKYY